MTIAATPVPLSEAKARLSELARRVRQQHERITLTRNGEPEAVLVSVDDLEGMLQALQDAGAQVDDRREESEYGKFGWVTDPEGNRLELWQPPRVV